MSTVWKGKYIRIRFGCQWPKPQSKSVTEAYVPHVTEVQGWYGAFMITVNCQAPTKTTREPAREQS